MSRFYGTLDGSWGRATRCGTAASGMRAVAASWSGAAVAETYAGENYRSTAKAEDEDFARLDLTTWHGAGRRLFVYDGPVNPSDEQFFAGLLPGAGADFLRCAAAALLARADALNVRDGDFAAIREGGAA